MHKTEHDQISDAALWIRWVGGDNHAGKYLSRRFLPVLQSFFRSKVLVCDVDDVVQQVWLALGETLRRREVVEFQSSLRAYLLGIARYVLFRYLRGKNRSEKLDPLDSSIAVLEPSLSQAVGQQIQAQHLTRALQRLPLDVQILLELRYVQDLSNPEIATLYGIPEGTVKSRLSRARRQLDEELKKNEHI